MSWLNILYYIISALVGICATGIPFAFKLYKAIKARIEAQTIAEKEKAKNDMLTMAQAFVEGAEKAFEGFDKVMKAQNSSAGAMKKDTVFTKLQAYALQSGYEFDAEYWNEQIDKIVAFTREVNTHK